MFAKPWNSDATDKFDFLYNRASFTLRFYVMLIMSSPIKLYGNKTLMLPQLRYESVMRN